MSSVSGSSSGSANTSEMSAKHRKLVYNAIDSANAEAMLRAYHARGIDLGYCTAPSGESGPSMTCAECLSRRDVLRVLRELGVDPNTPDEKHGVTALYEAASQGRVESLRVLVELGADPNKPDREGRTPMYQAAAYGHIEVIRVLGELGADVNAARKDGCTPMYRAARSGHCEALRVLFKLGANLGMMALLPSISPPERTGSM